MILWDRILKVVLRKSKIVCAETAERLCVSEIYKVTAFIETKNPIKLKFYWENLSNKRIVSYIEG